MSGKNILFADQIVNLTVTGPLIRIDLATLAALPKSKGDPAKMEVSHQIVMPLDGFLASLKMQDAVVKKLIADGVIKVAADKGKKKETGQA